MVLLQYLIPPEAQMDSTTFNASDITISVGSSPFKAHTPDLYFPLFTIVEFLCYMGWVKVAESLLNPFGDDDEDFEVNYIIDRNMQTSYMILEEAEEDLEILPDPFLESGMTIPKMVDKDLHHQIEA